MATTTTATNWYSSTMSGAPGLTYAAGKLLPVLRMALTQNALSQTVSVTITGGVGVVTCPTSNPFSVGMNVKLTHGTYTPLNTTRRITAVSGLTYTIDCSDMVDGTYASATHTTASLGWTEVYTGTNVAVFKSAAASGSNCYLRVDDSGTYDAPISVYETMVDVDTGANPILHPYYCPLYWPKAGNSTMTTAWRIVGDDKTFYLATRPHWNTALATDTQSDFWVGFGQFTTALSSDSYNSFVSGANVTVNNSDYPATNEMSLNYLSAVNQPIYIQRHQNTIKRGVQARVIQEAVDFQNWPGRAAVGFRRGLFWESFHAEATNFSYSELYLKTQRSLRGKLRGILVPTQDVGQSRDLDGTLYKITSGGATKNYRIFREAMGMLMFDYDGTW